MKVPARPTAVASLWLLLAAAPVALATPAAPQENIRHVAHVPGSTGGHVVVEGDRLYVGSYGMGLTVFDITDLEQPFQIGEYKPLARTGDGFSPATGDPGARADAVPDATVINGKHIVTLNGTNRAQGTQRTEFLDMTDPANPVLLHTMTGAEGESHNGDIVDARGLWLPSGGRGGNMLRIYDVRPLAEDPAQAPLSISSGNLNTMWVESPYRLALGKPAGANPTHIHDLEVYTDHQVLLLENEWVDQNGDGTPDPTYTTKDLAFYAASQDYPLTVGASSGSPNSAVYIVDISDPAQPVVMNKIGARPGHRYLHEVQLLDADPSIMFTSDEDMHNGCDAGGVYSWRLTEDLMNAEYLDAWFNGTGTPAAECSAHVFSSGGDKVFMGSYQAGLQVIDFSDPSNLSRAGQFIAEGANSWGALYHEGYVYVGDFGARGLDVFEYMGEDALHKVLPGYGLRAWTDDNGVTEAATECDPDHPANGVDAFIVEIPEDLRDGTHRVRATANGDARPYDLDLWFYTEDCRLIDRVTPSGRNPTTTIREGEAYLAVTRWSGYPGTVWVQFDPNR